jgi:iron complex outermembrane receptor protein
MLVAAISGANAQQLSISGTVRDAQAVAPGVSVTLRGPAGGTAQATTDGMGQYRFEGLTAGQYELTFAREGFETTTRILSLTTESRTADVTLSLGGVSTSLQVIDVAGKATSSRMEIPDLELPVQVSSIPQVVLQQQGTNDLATALRNISGVAAQRFYGIYEYYTVRGFHQGDVLLVDGMRLEGNRFNTQLNNVEQVEVLKGPSSILYGGRALSGAINIIRKKPQGIRAYDFLYRGGRFNTHQVAGGATGPLVSNRFLYRVDTSFEHAGGWRGAGADRFNVSPAVTWLISERGRVTVHQAFNRDNFDGDGGLPLALINLPGFDLSRRFSTPYDFSRIRDSQTNVLFNYSLAPAWEVRDGFFYRWANDEYFITEGLTYNPGDNAVDRYALYFKHHRRPVLNQVDVVGRFNLLGMHHTVLAGHEYQDFYNYTDRTPEGGDFFPTSISLADFRETQGPFSFDIVERDFFTNRIHAFFWQDQIAATKNLSFNVGGRYDDYRRIFHNDFRDTGSGPFDRAADRQLNQTAYTYRAGAVYALPLSHQVYFNAASSFQPVTTLPTSGEPLKPETGRSYEAGYRWQGLTGRLRTSLAFYQIERQNVVISRGMGRFDQAGQQTAKGIDLDISGDLGYGLRVTANYGYTLPRFDQFFSGVDLSGRLPRFAQRHAANLWIAKSWNTGFMAGAGMRYLGPVFTNNANSVRLGGYTTFTGFAGYRRGNWEWSINAENLLNRARYFQGSDYDDQVYPGAPINVFSTIRFRFR